MIFGVTVVSLFALNVIITGDLNYQGGDRNTFYGGAGTGFPFQTPQSVFVSNSARATNAVPWEVLINRDALFSVFPRNLIYFTFGRHTGLVPYFFPGALSLLLFLFARGTRARRSSGSRRCRSWPRRSRCCSTCRSRIRAAAGPIGNRYFLGFYPLLLFVTPPLVSLRPALAAMAIGGLFTAQLVLNPFYVSFHPAEHMKRGAYPLAPRRAVAVERPADERDAGEGASAAGGHAADFGVFPRRQRLHARRGVVLGARRVDRRNRAPRAGAPVKEDGSYESLRLKHIVVEARAGDVANEVVVKSATNRSQARLEPQSTATLTVRVGGGLPYKPVPGLPTNYVYLISIRSKTGFFPLFSSGSRDNRFLGAMIRITPAYE